MCVCVSRKHVALLQTGLCQTTAAGNWSGHQAQTVASTATTQRYCKINEAKINVLCGKYIGTIFAKLKLHKRHMVNLRSTAICEHACDAQVISCDVARFAVTGWSGLTTASVFHLACALP